MDLEPRPPIGLRASIGVLMKVALGLAATEAAAFQDHYLYVSAGNQADSTDVPTETSLEVVDEQGVPGVDPFAYHFKGSVDSDSGVLATEARVNVGPGLPLLQLDAEAAIEQWLLIDGGDGPLSLTFQLDFNGSAEVMGQASAEISARLDVSSACRMSVHVRANEDPEVSDNCTGSFSGGNVVYTGSAGAGGMTVHATYAAGFVPSTLDINAQLTSHLALGLAQLASASGSGALAIGVEGADAYSFTSPTFLTAPEPSPALLGLAAAAALAWRARRLRGAPR
jgi:hypothetical protein